MNCFKKLFYLCSGYDLEENKTLREMIKVQICEITKDIVGCNIEEIEIYRRDSIGFKAKYSKYGNEDFIKITFSKQTNKAYIYDGINSYEFKVL